MTNFPPPSGVADEIVAKAIECLDADVWHAISDTSITIRDVRFHLQTVDIVINPDNVEVLRYGKPSTPYREAFKDAYGQAMRRRREKLMAEQLAWISNEDYGKPVKRRPLWWAPRAVIGLLAVSFLAWGVGSIVSCSQQQAAIEAARNEEVNKYGYKRGAIMVRKVWPDDCARSSWHYRSDPDRSFSYDSVYDCREMWERWEREGRAWVDWKDEK